MQGSTITPVPYLSQVLNLLQRDLKPARVERKPKFKVLQFAPDPGNPWKETGTDDDPSFVQFEITRDFATIEVIAEVPWVCEGPGRCWLHAADVNTGCEENHTTSDCIKLGPCYDLYGNERILTLEEEDEARKEWVRVQEYRASKERE